MAEKSLNEIPRNQRELYEKGNAALAKKNYDYAIAIYNQVLQNEPAFYECRESLRATQFHKAGSGGGFFKKMFGTASSSPQLAKAQFLVRNNPVETLAICEQVLNGDPSNGLAHKLLAEAAMALEFPKTAVLSLEIVFKNNPRDRDVALHLSEALVTAGNVTRAETIITDLQRAHPNDQEISQTRKNIAARRTMREGGYHQAATGQASYRDMLKDKEQAATLEQQERQVKSEDVATQLLAEYQARLEQNPGDRQLLRSMADLSVQKKEFGQALEYLERAVAAGGAGDPSLQKAMTDTRVKKLEHEIAQLDAEDPLSADKKRQIEIEKQEFQVAQALAQVERNPTDLGGRFDLGVLYFNTGKINEAIQEFQKAQNNPHKKVQSLYYLGQCFAARGMNDLAVRSLQNALRDKQGFDTERKEIIYALGSVLQKMGRKEEAIEQFKQIYEADIGFRDVSQKVDEYYANGG